MTDEQHIEDLENQEAREQEAPAQEQASPEETLRAERDELQDRLMRQAAEFENFRKRTERDKAEFLKRANEGMARDLLPVIDNLERALEAAADSKDVAALFSGVEMIQGELMRTLERYGMERVQALGQPFDPELHEAVMQQENADAEDNTVLSEYQKGYLFQGRLLRPAMVVVSKRPAGSDDDGVEIEIKG